MNFASEEERMQHPYARLIPESIWREFFSSQVNGEPRFLDVHLKLMSSSEAELEALIPANTYSEHTNSNRRIWFALAYREIALNEDTLVQFLKKIVAVGHPEFDIYRQHLKTAVIYGKTTLIDKILSEVTPETRKTGLIRKVLGDAIDHNATEVLTHLLTSLSEKKFSPATIKELNTLLTGAVCNNNTYIVNFFINYDRALFIKLIASEKFKVFQEAAAVGQLDMMRFLGEQVGAETFGLMIESADYNAFNLAAKNYHMHVLAFLVESVSSEKLKQMLAANDYAAFIDKGYVFDNEKSLAQLDFLLEKSAIVEVDFTQKMLMAENNNVFLTYLKNGNFKAIKNLLQRAYPDVRQALLELKNQLVFHTAASKGDDVFMDYLFGLIPEQDRLALIEADDYRLFQSAASALNIGVTQYLIDTFPEQRTAMIVSNHFMAFESAVNHSYLYTAKQEQRLGLLQCLLNTLESEPRVLQEMLETKDYFGFRLAVKWNWVDVVNLFISSVAPDKRAAMIMSNKFEAFDAFANESCSYRINQEERLILLHCLVSALESEPLVLQEMLAVKEYAVFRLAVKWNWVDVVNILLSRVALDQCAAMILSNNGEAFANAAASGNFDLMKSMLALVPGREAQLIESGHYAAFSAAARCEDEDVISFLIGLAPDNTLQMIQAENYKAFNAAIEYSNLNVIKQLLSLVDFEQQTLMVNAAVSSSALLSRCIRELGHDVATILFPFSAVYAHFEAHQREFNKFIKPFTEKQLKALKKSKLRAEAQDPNVVFDIAAEPARLFFYVIRNLIRRNKPELLDDIQFLVDIPAVRSLLHTAVTPHQDNELLRLALSLSNEGAAQRLMNVTAVRELARTNNFYRQEARGAVDLRVVAADAESSMRGLSTGEQRRLKDMVDVYEPMMREKGGAKAVLNLLRETLKQRYRQNPAKITGADGVEVAIRGISQDQLAADRSKVVKALFAHKDETALRYISKPNLLLANSPYIYRGRRPDGREVRWSTFVDYEPLIAMLFLAASDERTDPRFAPCDGHTVETRLTHFISELAFIGRAHNWDKKRNKKDEHGHDILDVHGKAVMEEYDDLGPDNPSCFSGVKRRLFQSVLGHPLLKMLTMDDVKDMTRDYVRGYFKAFIDASEDKVKLKNAWINACEYPSEKDLRELRVMNVPGDKQETFIASLVANEVFGIQFASDPAFKSYIYARFSADNHAVMFGGETALTQLFDEACLSGSKRRRGFGFFDDSEASSSHDEKSPRRDYS